MESPENSKVIKEVNKMNLTESPEVDNSNSAQAPEVESNSAPSPKVDESNSAQSPKVDESNAAQSPKVDESNSAQSPKVDESNAAQSPEVAESNSAQSPEVVESNTAKSPEVDKNSVPNSAVHPIYEFESSLSEETIKRTINCTGFPKDGSVTVKTLQTHFKPYGPFEKIHMRQFFDSKTKKCGFTGSILMVYVTEDKAQQFLDSEDILYKDYPLKKVWYKDFLDEKNKRIDERKAKKVAKQHEKGQQETNTSGSRDPTNTGIEDGIPPGCFVHAKGFTNETTREHIRAVLKDHKDKIAFLAYSKGEAEGYIRLSTPFSNKEFIEEIDGKFQVEGADITVRIVEGDEEASQIKKAEDARARFFTRPSRKRRWLEKGGRSKKNRNK